MQNGFPSKKLLPETSSMSTEQTIASSINASSSDKKSRLVIPTKDNPPPEMSDWLTQFQKWTNAERILAINELIARCEPTQVRHMMQVKYWCLFQYFYYYITLIRLCFNFFRLNLLLKCFLSL